MLSQRCRGNLFEKLKNDLIYRGQWETRTQLMAAVNEYIEYFKILDADLRLLGIYALLFINPLDRGF